MSAGEWLLAYGVVVLAASLQGSIGFGFAITAAPLLMLIDSTLVPGALVVCGIPLTTAVLLRERHHLKFRSVGVALLGNALGTGLAAWVLIHSTGASFSLLFGVLVLAAVGIGALGLAPRLRPRNSLLAGLAGGFMGTTTTIGGPPIALLYQRESPSRMRADLSAYFLVSMALTIVALVAVGRLGAAEAKRGALLIPGVALGFLISSWLAPRLHREWARRTVLAAAALCALFLIGRSF